MNLRGADERVRVLRRDKRGKDNSGGDGSELHGDGRGRRGGRTLGVVGSLKKIQLYLLRRLFNRGKCRFPPATPDCVSGRMSYAVWTCY